MSPKPRLSRRRMVSDQREVDAVENPTELFQRINSGDWDGALLALNRDPVEASTWVLRLSKYSNKINWKYLPLHLVCLHQSPPWPLLQALLEVYPKAVSTPTQHDGNLPIHYVCESGCNDMNVLKALITAFPNCMLAKNGKNKTPLMICHPRTINALKKVLKEAPSSPLTKVRVESPRSTPRRKSAKYRRVDRRNATDFFSRDASLQEQRQLPDSIQHSSINWDSPVHRSPNNFDFSYSLSSDVTETSSSSSPPHHFGTPRTPKGKEHTHEDITEQLQNLTLPKETSDMKLCDRILAKAELESVSLRAHIQQLQREKSDLEKKLKAKGHDEEESLNFLTKVLLEQEDKARIQLFKHVDESSTSNVVCVTNAVLKLLSHMERKNRKASEHINSLQKQLSKNEVKHKSAQANNEVLQNEKHSITTERDVLEAMVTTLEDEKESLKKELHHEKETSTSLRVINQSLREQIDSAIGELPGNDKNLRSQLRCLNADLQKMKDDQANCVESQRYQEQIATLLEEQKSMRDKNQALKDTIRDNNEAYSRKIMELEKMFEEMEHANKKLRQKMKVNTSTEKKEQEI